MRNHDKISIRCPEHGVFNQTPGSHLNGNGCPGCGNVQRMNREKFITRGKQVHDDRYDYSQVVYRTMKDYVTIICPDHGEFKQQPDPHLTQGVGCPACGRDVTANARRKTLEQFIEDARKLHGDKYDYSKVDYITGQTKVVIGCPEHGDFKQDPLSHTQRSGCPECTVFGFQSKKPAVFYYARIDRFNEKSLYMVGVTNHSFEKRYQSRDRGLMTLLLEQSFELGADAAARERQVLKENVEYLYAGSSPLRSKGGEVSREIFIRDVLGLDRYPQQVVNLKYSGG